MSKVTRYVAKGMTLTTAESIANAAICHAVDNNFPPVTVVVLDSAGHVVLSKRMDGCPPIGNDCDGICLSLFTPIRHFYWHILLNLIPQQPIEVKFVSYLHSPSIFERHPSICACESKYLPNYKSATVIGLSAEICK